MVAHIGAQIGAQIVVACHSSFVGGVEVIAFSLVGVASSLVGV